MRWLWHSSSRALGEEASDGRLKTWFPPPVSEDGLDGLQSVIYQHISLSLTLCNVLKNIKKLK